MTARLAAVSNNACWLAGEYNRAVYALRLTFEVATVARIDRLTRAFGIMLLRARLRGFARPLTDASVSASVSAQVRWRPLSSDPSTSLVAER